MKKLFVAPKLSPHGSLEELTMAFGPRTQSDSIVFGDLVIGGLPGSQDGIVVPKTP